MMLVRELKSVCVINIKKWFTNPRIYILGLIMGLVLICYSYDYYKVSSEIGYGVNILGLFVSVYGGAPGFTRIMTLFGSVLLFCDAPFMDENQQFVYLRLGRKRWVAGTLIYVFVTSFIDLSISPWTLIDLNGVPGEIFICHKMNLSYERDEKLA